MQDHLAWDRVHVVGHRSAPASSKPGWMLLLPGLDMVLLSVRNEPVRLWSCFLLHICQSCLLPFEDAH